MNFIIGYTVRPKNINRLNQVIYEEYVAEALVEVLPTLDECEAYGFVFNNSDSKCYIANNPLVFNNPSATQNLSIARASNTIGRNTRDNLISGASHILTSNNYSNVISGDNNTVTDLVSNTTISGARAEATATNSIVLGGNASNDSNNLLGDELVENGDFSEIGAEEILNGDFSEIGGELVENGSFTPGIELVENGNFQDFEDATGGNLDGGVQFADWNVNPSTGKRKLTNIVDGFRNDVIVKQTSFWHQRVYQSVSSDLEVGKYYRFKATFITSDLSSIRVAIQTLGSTNVQAGATYPTEAGISQSIDLFFKCTSATSQYIDVFPTSTQEIGESFYLQKVSLKEVGQEWRIYGVASFLDNAVTIGASANSGIFQNIGLVNGKSYTASINVTENNGVGTAQIINNSGQNIYTITGTGLKTFTFVHGITDATMVIRGLSNSLFTFSSISVKEVGQDWDLGTGWSIGDGVVHAVAGSGSKLIQTNTLNGKFCKVTLTVSNYGGTSLVLVDFGSVSSSYITSNGTHTVYGTYDANNFEIYKASGFSGDITNISVKEVGQDWTINSGVDATHYIEFPGIGARYVSGTTSPVLGISQSPLIVGKTYTVTCNITYAVGSGSLRCSIGGVNQAAFTEGFNTRTSVASSFTSLSFLRNATNVDAIITNVSAKEVLPYVAPRQSIQLLYSYQSTDGSNKSSFLNGITDSLFAIPENSVMYFHADVIAVRVGGTDTSGGGAVGDYGSWVERGVIINKSGVLSISRERDTIKHSGHTTNWQPTGIVDGTNFAMRVRGHADMTIEWASNITFTEIKTGVAL